MVAVQVASVVKELDSAVRQTIGRSASGDMKGCGRRDGLAAGMTRMSLHSGATMMTRGMPMIPVLPMNHGVHGSASNVLMSTCL